MRDVCQLEVTPDEAWIIEMALKGDVGEHRMFLVNIARCIVTEMDVEIGVQEKDLWFLKSKIQATAKVGRATGRMLLEKIYNLIVSYYKVEVTEFPVGQFPLVKYDGKGKNRTKGRTSNHSRGRTKP